MSDDALRLAGHKLGNYRLHRILGRGNMGVVYLATDEALLRPTAVKVLTWAPTQHDPEAWFLAEARSVARLNHPSVVQIYAVARHGPHCYIAMEYVDGVSADVTIARGGPLGVERAAEVIAQLAAALELAHASGIVHRDVKPANILLKQDGTTKLGDFGMATSTRGQAPAERAGTPHYFAPEIWRGDPASAASDLYALGATFFHLVTGRTPFDGATLAALGAAHLHEELVIPPALAEGPAAPYARIIRRCLAKVVSDRYASAAAITRDLDAARRPAAAVAIELAAASSPPLPTLGPADAGWQARDFQYEPFAELDPRTPPYAGAPFCDLRREIEAQLARPGMALVLGGAAGSGRTVLARAALASHAGRGVYVDAVAGARAGLIPQLVQALRPTSSVSGPITLEGLLEMLAVPEPAAAPLLVIDGVIAGTRAAADAAILARAARSTRHFNMLVVGTSALAIKHGGPILAAALDVPPLAPADVGSYLASWLRATRAAAAPPLLITVDAALIAGHRAAGNLVALNALARTMIARGGAVLTSWDAWAVPDDSDRAAAPPSARPAEWPPPDVLALINERRTAAGLAPRGTTT